MKNFRRVGEIISIAAMLAANLFLMGASARAATGQTLFTTQTPGSTGQSDGPSVNYELGAAFQTNTAGQITAIRFWKDANETGTHTGRIWSGTGTLLASVTFASEAASGWQQQALTAPLSVAANITYVVTVNTGNTFYVATTGGLSSQVINGNLRSVVGNNGVYGAPGAFPTNSWQGSNYFRDVVFVPVSATPTYSISGTIGPLATGPGTTVTLSGATSATALADSSGNYTFSGLANGGYTVTPSKAGFTFSPTNASPTVSNANIIALNFTAAAVPTYGISGTVGPLVSGPGTTLTLSGAASATAVADSSGNYSFTGLANGGYTVTPSKAGFTFSPTNASRTVSNANISALNFTMAAMPTYSISGTVGPLVSGPGTTLTLSGAASATAVADSSGNFSFSGLANGSYTVTPSKAGLTFSPTNASRTVSNANMTGLNFTAAAVPSYNISGMVGPLVSGPGTTLTLSGAASATAVADSSGNYTFSGLANGSYTVTPSKAGFTFTPTSAPVSVSNANVSLATFTATGNAAGQTLFTTQAPAEVGQSDGASVNYELGTVFQSNTTGQITAIRFWKDAKEVGSHTGRIWSSGGTLLASVVFVNETTSGWQQQTLTSPLGITANTAYVVSVNTGNTYYVATTSGLASQVANGNLSSVVGSNGVSGPTATFPANSWSNSNYFRDVVFVPVATSGPPTITTQPASKSITAGQTATLTVAAAGAAPMSHQWRKNGTAIGGATSATYTTPAATTSDNGAQFTVTVTNSFGSVTSAAATLTVTSATYLLNSNTSALSFGNVSLSTIFSQTVTLTDAGNSNVSISNVSISGAGFSASGVPAGLILSPGQTATLSVTFLPVATGIVAGSVTVTSNATNSPDKITLSGTGILAVPHSASLSWIASTSTVIAYNCYSSTVSGGPYTKITATPVTTTSYTDSTVQSGKTYYYVVTSVNSAGVESAYSTQVSAVIP